MRIELTPQSLNLLPESGDDQFFIEQVLGLRHHLDSIPLKRISVDTDGGAVLMLQARPTASIGRKRKSGRGTP